MAEIVSPGDGPAQFAMWRQQIERRLDRVETARRLPLSELRGGALDIVTDAGALRARLGVLPDSRAGQVFYDASGNELIRLGQLPDDSYGLAAYNAGVEQARFNSSGVSVVRSGVRTNLADYIFGEQTSFVADAESTTSTSYVNLATDGPSVTVTVGASGRVRLLAGVEASTEVITGTGNHGARFGYSASGANTIGDTYLGLHDAWSQVSGTNLSRASISSGRVISGLSAGSTTFKLRYSARTTGTAFFANRWLIVQPL